MQTPHGRAQVNALFGNPAGANGELDMAWYNANITTVELPYPMVASWDASEKTHKVYVHKKLATILVTTLQQVWDHARKLVKVAHGDLTTAQYDALTTQFLANLGLNQFGGTFNFRPIRGSKAISLHAYGAAIDIDPSHNELGATEGRMPFWVVTIFKDNGWMWGGDFQGRKDWMHFQFATGC